jgi:hypothetical protein
MKHVDKDVNKDINIPIIMQLFALGSFGFYLEFFKIQNIVDTVDTGEQNMF